MKRIVSVILVLCAAILLCSPVAALEKQYDYSTTANSGVRHEVCTTLLGSGAEDYYTGSCTYDHLCRLDGDTLLQTLRALLTDTHTHTTTFGDCRDLASKTDCQDGDGVTISLLYTGYTATQEDWIVDNYDGWNRGFVWPQSLAGFKASGPGADLHHIRPSDQQINGLREFLKYGNVTDGTTAMAVIDPSLDGGTWDGTYFEPHDNIKGDIARIILYVYVRYGGDSRYDCSSITTVFESVDVLLEWCALDPVDTWEMGRNQVVEAIQGNRNVFIDYPELAWVLFDRPIPTDLTTPSGAAASFTVNTCTHTTTHISGACEPSCTADGYTGDLHCSDCGQLISAGTVIPATGHTNENGDQTCDYCAAAVSCGHGKTATTGAKAATCSLDGYTGDTSCAYCGQLLKTGATTSAAGHTAEITNARDAGCTTDGYSGDTVCNICGELLTQGEVIPAAGVHTFGDWTVTKEAAPGMDGCQERTCSLCGETEIQILPALTTPTTQPETAPATGSSTAPVSDIPLSSNSMLLIIVILVAVCASAVITWVGSRKKQHTNAADPDCDI